MEPMFLPQLVARLVRCFAVDGSLTKILGDNTYDEFPVLLGVNVSELLFASHTHTDQRRIGSERKDELVRRRIQLTSLI